MTAIRTARPWWRTRVVQPANRAATMAPSAVAEDSSPTPAGPTPNTSSAIAGNSERGEPKTIAMRSTTNVASTGRRRQANRSPSAMPVMLGRTAPGAGGIGAMNSSVVIAAP